jgi:hypothetical protein
MQLSPNETNIVIAFQALKQDPNLSVRRPAKVYEVSHTTLLRRKNGVHAKRDIIPKTMKLTITEEETILERTIDLIERGLPP